MNPREQATMATMLLSGVCVTIGAGLAVNPAVGIMVLGVFLFLVAMLLGFDSEDGSGA